MSMVVRVRVRIRIEDKDVETTAFANSGYETETPQLLVPIRFAERVGKWPPVGAIRGRFETAGGPVDVWIYPRACRVKVVEEDAESSEVISDLVICPFVDEVLMSDKLIGELGIALEDVGRGLWRFRWEPTTRLRRSYPPEHWR